MSDATRRHIMLPALLAFFLGALPYPLMKDDQSTAPSSISNAGPLARDIREEDRKFLDDLLSRNRTSTIARMGILSPLLCRTSPTLRQLTQALNQSRERNWLSIAKLLGAVN